MWGRWGSRAGRAGLVALGLASAAACGAAGAPATPPAKSAAPPALASERTVVDSEGRYRFYLPRTWVSDPLGAPGVPERWRSADAKVEARVLLLSSDNASAMLGEDLAKHCAGIAESLRAGPPASLRVTLEAARLHGAFATCTFVIEYERRADRAPVVVHHMGLGTLGTTSLVVEMDRADYAAARPIVARILSSFETK